MEIQKYFDEKDKIIESLDELIKNEIDNDVDAIDEKIAIFKRFSDESYYYPYNKTALNYCLYVINRNFKRLNNNINFRVLDDKDQMEIRKQFNLLPNLFNKIKIKKKGKVKIDQDILIFQYYKNELKPLNQNSKINYINIFELIINTPKTNENLWKKLNINV